VPTYWKDVRPILEGRCADCHSAGGIAPFELGTFEDARAYGSLVLATVEAGTMPPWGAVSGHQAYAQDPSLSVDQIATVTAWVEADMPEGDRADAVDALPSLALELPRVDLSLAMPEPYVPDDTTGDDYRCFLVEWTGVGLRYVTGFEVIPDNTSVVHHVAAFLVRPDTLVGPGVLDDFRGFDDAEEGPGYTCFGGPSGANEVQIPIQQVAQWVPGNGAVLFPSESGIPIPEGSLVVLQMHYSTGTWDGLPDQTQVDFVVSDSVARKGAFAPFLNPLWPMGGMPIPAGGVSTQTHEADPVGFFELMISDMDLTGGFDIQAAMLHMHLSGQRGQVELRRASGETEVLLEVDPWDFNWQLNYQLLDPVRYDPGDTLYLECVWDNQTGADLDWGEGSHEEMCVGNLFITEP